MAMSMLVPARLLRCPGSTGYTADRRSVLVHAKLQNPFPSTHTSSVAQPQPTLQTGPPAPPVAVRDSTGAGVQYAGPAMVAVVAGITAVAWVRRAFNRHEARMSESEESLLESVDASPSSSSSPKGRKVVTVGVGEDPTELINAPAFDRIFKLFDRDGNGSIDFKEAALGLKKIKPTVSLSKAKHSAIDIFLLFDDDHNRVLDRFEFARFLARFCTLVEQPFSALSGQLVSALEKGDTLNTLDQDDLLDLETMPDAQFKATLEQRKLDEIFDLYDHDQDGLIETAEVRRRMERFLDLVRLASEDRRNAAQLIAQELPSNGVPEAAVLTRRQFRGFVSQFAAQANLELFEVADVLLVIPAKDDARVAASASV